jgi:hypothetical protein
LIDLALASGIAPSVWADEDERTIATAIDLLKRHHRKHGSSPAGPITSG